MTSSDDVLALIEEAVGRLRGLAPVVELGGSVFLFVGDTHGYPEVSEWALGLAGELSVDAVVFLGDYVDRGPRGVENLELLLNRMLEDEGLLLLRGNHESLLMNGFYGFAEEARGKRGREYLAAVEQLYRFMPLAVAAPKAGVVALHGGVPCRRCSGGAEEPPGLGEISDALQAAWGGAEMDEPSHPLAFQILWNDPRGGIDWFLPSPRGPGAYLYGRMAWRSFLEANDARLLIRAHEAVDAVEAWRRDGSLLRGPEHGAELSLGDLEYAVVTVFSSLYHGRGAGALLVDGEEDRMVVFRYPHGPDKK